MGIALATVLALAATTPLVFGENGHFAVVSRAGQLVRRVGMLCGRQPLELALSSDHESAAFTAREEQVENTLLYACRAGELRLLGERVGYHANPAFSPDGVWVYFAHHPKKGGPPGLHEPGANAQLYRVRFDGSSLEALTSDRGCKQGPQVLASGSVLYVHATCHGPKSVEVMTLKDRRSRKLSDFASYNSPDLSPRGESVLASEQTLATMNVVVLGLKGEPKKLLFEVAGGDVGLRASWTDKGDGVLYQHDGSVWLWRKGADATRLFKIEGE